MDANVFRCCVKRGSNLHYFLTQQHVKTAGGGTYISPLVSALGPDDPVKLHVEILTAYSKYFFAIHTALWSSLLGLQFSHGEVCISSLEVHLCTPEAPGKLFKSHK